MLVNPSDPLPRPGPRRKLYMPRASGKLSRAIHAGELYRRATGRAHAAAPLPLGFMALRVNTMSTWPVRIPRVCSLSALRRRAGRSGRCSRQKATYGLVAIFLAGGASADARAGGSLLPGGGGGPLGADFQSKGLSEAERRPLSPIPAIAVRVKGGGGHGKPGAYGKGCWRVAGIAMPLCSVRHC